MMSEWNLKKECLLVVRSNLLYLVWGVLREAQGARSYFVGGAQVLGDIRMEFETRNVELWYSSL